MASTCSRMSGSSVHKRRFYTTLRSTVRSAAVDHDVPQPNQGPGAGQMARQVVAETAALQAAHRPPVRQRPRQASATGSVDVFTDRTLAQSKALADHPLRQMVFAARQQPSGVLSLISRAR
jgi:hypothetical protein